MTGTPGAPSSARILEIECLRGIAVLFVVIHHARDNLFHGLPAVLEAFYGSFGLGIGVDIFFAISGFVITRQLVSRLDACSDRAGRRRELVSFWVRRFWRLLPSAWLWLGLTVLAAAFLNRSGAFGPLGANLEAALAGVLQVANFRLARVFGTEETGASFVYWSLSLEEQFYLLFPLLVVFFRRWLALLLAGVFLVQLVLPRTGLGMVLRTDGIALGCLLALAQARPAYRGLEPRFLAHPGARWPLLLAVLAGLGWLGTNAMLVAPFTLSLVAVLAAGLVFLASYDAGYAAPPVAFGRFLAWVGARSYSLYLIHIPAFLGVREIFFRLGYPAGPEGAALQLAAAGLFLLVTLVAVELNHRLVELPGRRYGADLARRIAAGGA